MAEIAQFGKIGNWLSSLEAIRTSSQRGAESIYYYEWAERPVILSEAYYAVTTPESLKFSDGPTVIHDIMYHIDSMFLHELSRCNNDYLAEKGFRRHILDIFKDPGVLHHFVFWDLSKDLTAIIFEWHRFHGEGKMCVDMLHGQNYDIFGRPCLSNAISGPWEHLLTLYRDEIEHPRDNEYAQKLFSEVLGWPIG